MPHYASNNNNKYQRWSEIQSLRESGNSSPTGLGLNNEYLALVRISLGFQSGWMFSLHRKRLQQHLVGNLIDHGDPMVPKPSNIRMIAAIMLPIQFSVVNLQNAVLHFK